MADRSPSRLFEFEPQNRNGLRSNGYRFENNGSFTPVFPKDDWHFSWCWPWVPLSIFVPAAACFVHGRVTRDDISGETYHGYPRPFRGIKSRISKERQKDLPVVVNFMQISGFPWIRQLSPPHRWDPKESRSLPFREILCTPFIVCYLFLRDK